MLQPFAEGDRDHQTLIEVDPRDVQPQALAQHIRDGDPADPQVQPEARTGVVAMHDEGLFDAPGQRGRGQQGRAVTAEKEGQRGSGLMGDIERGDDAAGGHQVDLLVLAVAQRLGRFAHISQDDLPVLGHGVEPRLVGDQPADRQGVERQVGIEARGIHGAPGSCARLRGDASPLRHEVRKSTEFTPELPFSRLIRRGGEC